MTDINATHLPTCPDCGTKPDISGELSTCPTTMCACSCGSHAWSISELTQQQPLSTGFILAADRDSFPTDYEMKAFRNQSRSLPIFAVEMNVSSVNEERDSIALVAAPDGKEAGRVALEHYALNLYAGDWSIAVCYVNPGL